MPPDYLKEKIKVYTEFLKLFFVLLIGLITGLISIAFDEKKELKDYLLMGAGGTFFMAVLVLGILLVTEIFRMLGVLKKGS